MTQTLAQKGGNPMGLDGLRTQNRRNTCLVSYHNSDLVFFWCPLDYHLHVAFLA